MNTMPVMMSVEAEGWRWSRRGGCRAVVLGALVLLAGMTAGGFAGPAAAQSTGQATGEQAMVRSVTVSASATVAADPDIARITAGVATEAPTAAQALKQNSELIAKVIGGLKEMGIEPRDLQTSEFSVQPRYDHSKDGRPPKLIGYHVSNELAVVVRKLDGLGAVIDKVVSLGANQIRGLSFEVSQAETLKDEARKEAIANARRRAELFAAAAGARVGQVLSISEDVQHIGHPRPMMASRAAIAEAVPIEAGQQMLEARVTVTWTME